MGKASNWVGEESSTASYYPPRARWRSRFWYWGRRQRTWLNERLTVPRPLSCGTLLLCLALPGHIFRLIGAPHLARLILAGWCLGFLVLAATLGRFSANLALGLMTASHVLCLAKLVQWTVGWRGGWGRFFLTASLLGLCWTFLYLPLRQALVHHWAAPLLIRDQVIMINPRLNLHTIRRGDLLAYRFEEFSRREFRVAGGGGLEPVLGLPGDKIEFLPDGYRVNGVQQAALSFMPTNGVVHVPEMHWFFWPRLGILVHGPLPSGSLQAMLQQVAMVPGNQIMGRPYSRWLGLKQTMP